MAGFDTPDKFMFIPKSSLARMNVDGNAHPIRREKLIFRGIDSAILEEAVCERKQLLLEPRNEKAEAREISWPAIMRVDFDRIMDDLVRLSAPRFCSQFPSDFYLDRAVHAAEIPAESAGWSVIASNEYSLNTKTETVEGKFGTEQDYEREKSAAIAAYDASEEDAIGEMEDSIRDLLQSLIESIEDRYAEFNDAYSAAVETHSREIDEATQRRDAASAAAKSERDEAIRELESIDPPPVDYDSRRYRIERDYLISMSDATLAYRDAVTASDASFNSVRLSDLMAEADDGTLEADVVALIDQCESSIGAIFSSYSTSAKARRTSLVSTIKGLRGHPYHGIRSSADLLMIDGGRYDSFSEDADVFRSCAISFNGGSIAEGTPNFAALAVRRTAPERIVYFLRRLGISAFSYGGTEGTGFSFEGEIPARPQSRPVTTTESGVACLEHAMRNFYPSAFPFPRIFTLSSGIDRIYSDLNERYAVYHSTRAAYRTSFMRTTTWKGTDWEGAPMTEQFKNQIDAHSAGRDDYPAYTTRWNDSVFYEGFLGSTSSLPLMRHISDSDTSNSIYFRVKDVGIKSGSLDTEIVSVLADVYMCAISSCSRRFYEKPSAKPGENYIASGSVDEIFTIQSDQRVENCRVTFERNPVTGVFSKIQMRTVEQGGTPQGFSYDANFTTGAIAIYIDTGATMTITPDYSDCMEEEYEDGANRMVVLRRRMAMSHVGDVDGSTEMWGFRDSDIDPSEIIESAYAGSSAYDIPEAQFASKDRSVNFMRFGNVEIVWRPRTTIGPVSPFRTSS